MDTNTTTEAIDQGRRRRSGTASMKLEAVVIPVSDVDRAKRSYGNLASRLDADFVVGDSFRVVQFTPPGSPSSTTSARKSRPPRRARREITLSCPTSRPPVPNSSLAAST